MILYIEKQIKNNPQTKKIIELFKKSPIIFINNYKNIFDKNTSNFPLEKSIIIAELNSESITEAPVWYWHTDSSFFFKTSLNCVFDCSYCFLKWAFKNESQVYFLNYDKIKSDIDDKINQIKNNKTTRFYSSDYSDILWMNKMSNFIEEFVPFFEEKQGVMMEVRTKSANIKPLLDLNIIPKNTEIAFSLNPQSLIEKYEKWTSSLDQRLEAINILLEKWFKVWLRFLPLLPVKNYEEIYWEFISYIKGKLDISKISSTFASGLLFTKKDYNIMIKKYPWLDILYMLEESDDTFIRESKKTRDTFYKMFKDLDKKCMICLDN